MNDPVVLWTIIGILLFIIVGAGVFVYIAVNAFADAIFRSLWGGH